MSYPEYKIESMYNQGQTNNIPKKYVCETCVKEVGMVCTDPRDGTKAFAKIPESECWEDSGRKSVATAQSKKRENRRVR